MSLLNLSLIFICLFLAVVSNTYSVTSFISPLALANNNKTVSSETNKKGYQVYGYAPYWMLDKLNDVDFSALTTFAYFGLPLDAEGNINQDNPGYAAFTSDKANQIFTKAHKAGAKVNVTFSLMDNDAIISFLDNQSAQQNAINNIISTVKSSGLDGVSLDVEYAGTIDTTYREKYSQFVANVKQAMQQEMPHAQLTVAVYALSASQQQLYDLSSLSKNADSIFMMAYDFATLNADLAQPTAPLYGHKEGKYSYDIATAVEDFLKVMPAEKLILGVPYYGYNYSVYTPEVKSETKPSWAWSSTPQVQTYAIAQASVTPSMSGIDSYKTGWDDQAKVGWRAYRIANTNTWRMIFVEDEKSLGYKYDFIKQQNLAGVGIWALGYDQGHPELWNLLHEKFGVKNLADNQGLLAKEDTHE